MVPSSPVTTSLTVPQYSRLSGRAWTSSVPVSVVGAGISPAALAGNPMEQSSTPLNARVANFFFMSHISFKGHN